jgi:hypothetical protein
MLNLSREARLKAAVIAVLVVVLAVLFVWGEGKADVRIPTITAPPLTPTQVPASPAPAVVP